MQQQKMSALAELAAGAGHEINNPLAVISGQAQYLIKKLAREQELGGFEDSDSPKHEIFADSLKRIVTQTERVHQILSDLMQFARPVPPQPVPVDVASLVHDALALHQDLADQRRVRLVCDDSHETVDVFGDPRQSRTALSCLVRNAIESAPEDGWAGVKVHIGESGVDICVEDNGPWPAPTVRDHMFDPFFSGRAAGRGRGLGLPTAWQLARQNGGDVFFDPLCEERTRFILHLPIKHNAPPVSDVQRNGTHSGPFPSSH